MVLGSSPVAVTLSDSNASLAEWLSVPLQTKWLWVQISLLSLKLGLGRSSLVFRLTIEYGFTLKLVREMIITYSYEYFNKALILCIYSFNYIKN